MQLIDGAPVFSATDLVGYLACEHLTALERGALLGILERPHRIDRELEIIRKRGFAHEARYLDELGADGRRVVTIERDDDADRAEQIRRQAEATVMAMASGADVIYQATFFDGRWLGYADFLLKRDAPDRSSIWGPYHYEVADTKLARHVKAGAVLQVCSYVEQLERLQGVRPERMWIVLGGSARQTADLRVDDFMAYYRSAKLRSSTTEVGSCRSARRPPTPSRSSTATSAAGRRRARSGAATTITSRSSRASPGASARRSQRARSTPSFAWRTLRFPSSRRSTARAPRASSACASRRASRSRAAAS